MKKILILLISASLLIGCTAMHSGYMTGSGSLNAANFTYLTSVKGQSTATYILGIGGLEKETLVDDAQKNMLMTNPLRKNQALVNLTVNFKTTYYFFGLYSMVTCVVTADVVEFQ